MITSKKLLKQKKIVHGFFNKRGGVSSGIYTSLNCGLGSGDSKSNVKKNLKIVQNKISKKCKDIILLNQYHSKKLIFIDKNFKFKKRRLKADAIITDQKRIPIAVLTADCVPLLLYDSSANIIAAIHAGWKGAFKGIIKRVINFMLSKGCNKNNIRYFNSPHNSFETEACIKREKINHIFLLSGGIIKNNILNIENLIVYNAHPGRLPRHRGLSSLEWSIIENYPTSLTLHTLNNKIDEGDIIKIVDFKPKNNESINDFKKRMINFKPTIFSEVIKNIKNNNLVRIKQDYYEGIIHRKLSRRERKSLEKSYSILNNSTRGF